MKNYKKYLIILIVILTLMFPEYIFPGLVVLLIVVSILLLIIDIAFDVYIVIAVFIEDFRKK